MCAETLNLLALLASNALTQHHRPSNEAKHSIHPRLLAAEAATFHSAHTHSSTVTTAAPSTAIPAAPKSSLSQAATGDAAKVTSSGTASGVDEVGSTSWGQAGSHWPSPLATDHSPPSLPSAPDFCQGSAAQTAVPLTHSAQQLSLSATTEALPPPIAATPTGTPLSHLNSNTESQLRQHQQHQQFQHQQQVSPSLAVQHVPQTSSSSKRLAALQVCAACVAFSSFSSWYSTTDLVKGCSACCEVAVLRVLQAHKPSFPCCKFAVSARRD